MPYRPLKLTHSPRNILVITYGGIGDILMTTPLLASLKHAFPLAAIDAYVQFHRDGILQGNPHLRRTYTSRQRHGALTYTDFLFHCGLRYDLAVSTRISDRQVLFARVAGRRAISLVPPKGKNTWWKRRILNGWAWRDATQHVISDTLQLADVLDIPRITTCCGPRDPESAQRLTRLLPFSWQEHPFAVLHLAPRNRYKEWAEERWAAVAGHLHRQGLWVVVVGGPSPHEVRLADSLAKRSGPRTTSIAGHVSLADCAELLRRCRLYVGPDTAMTHLASVVGAPAIALYGRPHYRDMPAHDGLSKHPYTEVSERVHASCHVQLISGVCRCGSGPSVCAQHPDQPSSCMHTIHESQVIAAVDRVLISPTGVAPRLAVSRSKRSPVLDSP